VDRLDYKSGFAHSTTDHEGTISKGESEQRIPLLTVQYIMDLMPDEEVIGFYQDTKGMPPFKVHRMDWQRFPILKQRQSIPPPELYALPELENTTSSNGHLRKEVGAMVDSPRLVGF
jgi:type IV secretory pathway TraG/TraD family ATPase VirD4